MPITPPSPLPAAPARQVTISIKEKDRGNTSVTIEQSGLPAEDRFGHHNVADSSKEGWERLLRQIKAVFGWGA